MAMLMEAKGGRDITVYKSANFSSGSIQPRNLVKPEPEVMEMYKDLLKLAELA
jgi:hypothetical protein